MHFGSFGDRNNPCTQHVEPSAAEPSVSAGSSAIEPPTADEDTKAVLVDCNNKLYRLNQKTQLETTDRQEAVSKNEDLKKNN